MLKRISNCLYFRIKLCWREYQIIFCSLYWRRKLFWKSISDSLQFGRKLCWRESQIIFGSLYWRRKLFWKRISDSLHFRRKLCWRESQIVYISEESFAEENIRKDRCWVSLRLLHIHSEQQHRKWTIVNKTFTIHVSKCLHFLLYTLQGK